MAAPVYSVGQVLGAADCNQWFTPNAAIRTVNSAVHTGGTPTADQRLLVPYFEREGFWWGNNFSFPDPHHFEYVGQLA